MIKPKFRIYFRTNLMLAYFHPLNLQADNIAVNLMVNGKAGSERVNNYITYFLWE